MTLTGPFDAVIFDFDGTIADSYDAMVRAYMQWAREYGLTAEQLQGFTGVPSDDIARALLPEDVAAEAGRRIEELEIADTDGVVPLAGAENAFAAVPSDRRAIATSCTRPLLDARLAATGLPRPDVVVTRTDVERGKPAPDSFLLAAERMGVDPARCLVCEDAPAGVTAARAAGMAVLGILTNHTAEELAADWSVTTLADAQFAVTPDGITLLLR